MYMHQCEYTWVLEICFTCTSTMDNRKVFTHYCTWSRFGNSGVLLSWPLYDPVTGDSHRLFLTLKSQDCHFSHMQCDCFRDTLSAAWLCLLLQAISERWQRWVCVCLVSGAGFPYQLRDCWAIVQQDYSQWSICCNTSSFTYSYSRSVCMYHTALGGVHRGTAAIRGHGS